MRFLDATSPKTKGNIYSYLPAHRLNYALFWYSIDLRSFLLELEEKKGEANL